MNFKIRFKNPVFIVQIFLVILTLILAYAGLIYQDLTSLGNIRKSDCESITKPLCFRF